MFKQTILCAMTLLAFTTSALAGERSYRERVTRIDHNEEEFQDGAELIMTANRTIRMPEGTLQLDIKRGEVEADDHHGRTWRDACAIRFNETPEGNVIRRGTEFRLERDEMTDAGLLRRFLLLDGKYFHWLVFERDGDVQIGDLICDDDGAGEHFKTLRRVLLPAFSIQSFPWRN